MSIPLPPDRLRSVALTMHTLDRRDQVWLLRRLLPGVRMTLEKLLRELRSLGFAPHLGALAVDLPAPVRNVGMNQDDASKIDQANPGTISALLMRQPDLVQRALLHAHPWRWRAAVWEQMGPIRRSLLLEPLQESGMLTCKLNALLFGFVCLLHAEKAVAGGGSEGDQP
jgi:hypothetical protein